MVRLNPKTLTGDLIRYPAALASIWKRSNTIAESGHVGWYSPAFALIRETLWTQGSDRRFSWRPSALASMTGTLKHHNNNWAANLASSGPRVSGVYLTPRSKNWSFNLVPYYPTPQ